jgi:hypothetical protein
MYGNSSTCFTTSSAPRRFNSQSLYLHVPSVHVTRPLQLLNNRAADCEGKRMWLARADRWQQLKADNWVQEVLLHCYYAVLAINLQAIDCI